MIFIPFVPYFTIRNFLTLGDNLTKTPDARHVTSKLVYACVFNNSELIIRREQVHVDSAHSFGSPTC
jgi:hypothetical protein